MITMANYLVFENPAIAEKLREAGFIIFKQQYNGKECFATGMNADLMDIMSELKMQFETEQFAVAHTIHF